MTKTANPLPRPVPRLLAAIGWMGLIFLVSARSTVPQPPGITPAITSNLGHFSVYFVLAIIVWWALGGFGVEERRRWLLAFGLTVLYGLSDEWHQAFVPGRQPDVLDLLVDSVGAIGGLMAAEWAQRRMGSTAEVLAPTAGESPRRNSPRIADTN